MKTLLRFIFGLGVGLTLGMILVALFSPVSGQELRDNLREHIRQARLKAQEASRLKREALEKELKQSR